MSRILAGKRHECTLAGKMTQVVLVVGGIHCLFFPLPFQQRVAECIFQIQVVQWRSVQRMPDLPERVVYNYSPKLALVIADTESDWPAQERPEQSHRLMPTDLGLEVWDIHLAHGYVLKGKKTFLQNTDRIVSPHRQVEGEVSSSEWLVWVYRG